MLADFKKRIPVRGKKFKWLSICPFCGTRYYADDAKVVFEKENAYLLHTNCHQCGGSILATLKADQLGISSMGLITDLTFEDVIKFKDSPVVSGDDVLNAYSFLQNKDEDLRHLLIRFENSS